MQDRTFFDVLLSLGIGASLGWIVGGFWNLLQGRTWRGFQKGDR